jgi:hypothetical protein
MDLIDCFWREADIWQKGQVGLVPKSDIDSITIRPLRCQGS